MAGTKEADGPPAGPVKRGAFILFEGVDRCGKTTQANLLVESLKDAGHDACFMRFPGEPFAFRKRSCVGGHPQKCQRGMKRSSSSHLARTRSTLHFWHTFPVTGRPLLRLKF